MITPIQTFTLRWLAKILTNTKMPHFLSKSNVLCCFKLFCFKKKYKEVLKKNCNTLKFKLNRKRPSPVHVYLLNLVTLKSKTKQWNAASFIFTFFGRRQLVKRGKVDVLLRVYIRPASTDQTKISEKKRKLHVFLRKSMATLRTANRCCAK